jgi:hypothetical protein
MLFRLHVHTQLHTAETDIHTFPYGSDMYVIGSFFDPRFRLRWIDQEMQLEEHDREQLHKEITGKA